MKVPLSWLREYVDLPAVSAHEIADKLTAAGLKLEGIESVGHEIKNVVVGEVLAIEELTGFKKPIRYCQVEVGEAAPRGIICGATNFVAGDRVPVALPGAVLPGAKPGELFEISSRKTYGRISDGMICSARELGVGDDHSGILVLPADTPIGADVVELLGLRDDVLELEVTPDRGYALSIRGVAREAAIAFGVPFRDPADIELPADTGGCGRGGPDGDAVGEQNRVQGVTVPQNRGDAGDGQVHRTRQHQQRHPSFGEFLAELAQKPTHDQSRSRRSSCPVMAQISGNTVFLSTERPEQRPSGHR